MTTAQKKVTDATNGKWTPELNEANYRSDES